MVCFGAHDVCLQEMELLGLALISNTATNTSNSSGRASEETMGLWQHLAGRAAATAGRCWSTKWNRLPKSPFAPLPLVPILGQWKRRAAVLRVFEHSKNSGHHKTCAHLLGFPAAVICCDLGAHVVEAEEQSNNSHPSAGSSVLSEVHLSYETLVESQPGEAPSNSHTAKWRIYTDMGRDLFTKGRLDEAEKYFVQALEEAKKGFGEKNPHVASSCNNLAELYRMKKDYARAEPLFLEAVERLEEAFDSEDHESVGFALHNLGGTYLLQRKFEKARKCYERSLKIKERKLGQNHPEYANTLFHLGELLRLQGNYKDAEELIRASVSILEEGGVGHSQTAIRRMGRLAEILVHTDQMQEAENLQRKILHVLELAQGLEATSTTTAAENLAGTLQAIGKLKEAKELLQRCFQVRQKILPPNHIQCGDDLASKKSGHSLSDAKSEYETAEELLRRAIRVAERCWKDVSVARGPESLQVGPLISLLRSLDSFGRLKIRKLELATTSEEKEEGTTEAEKSFLQCLYILEKAGLPKELASIPEVQRQHIACLRHLAGLLSSVSYLNKGSSRERQIAEFISRSESIEAELRDRAKILKHSSF